MVSFSIRKEGSSPAKIFWPKPLNAVAKRFTSDVLVTT